MLWIKYVTIAHLIKKKLDVSKINENRCKQTLASIPGFWAYRKFQVTVLVNLPQNTAYARGSECVIFTCL